MGPHPQVRSAPPPCTPTGSADVPICLTKPRLAHTAARHPPHTLMHTAPRAWRKTRTTPPGWHGLGATGGRIPTLPGCASWLTSQDSYSQNRGQTCPDVAPWGLVVNGHTQQATAGRAAAADHPPSLGPGCPISSSLAYPFPSIPSSRPLSSPALPPP